MPLISDVDAAGLTVNELEAAIVDALKPDYLINPIVSAEVVIFRPIYIIGEVVNPGSYPYTNGMSVINAVAVAGGGPTEPKRANWSYDVMMVIKLCRCCSGHCRMSAT
jgi:protein involved in polysaccharide export with SLBB domain